MKAIVCKEFGPPEKLVLEELPAPALGAGDIRIAVAAAGVNFPDTLIIENRYQFRGTPPFVPGAEVAGTVIEAGPKAAGFAVGDRVAAMCQVGAFAEQVVTHHANAMKLPDDFDLVVAGGFLLAYGTTIHALKQRAELRAGETLLVLGASGGVGLSAVQIGKLMGARVIAAASSADKLAIAKAQGADELIDYSSASLKDAVKALTRGQGADVIYDPVGGALAQDCFSAIAWRGRYLVIGFAAGTIPEVALNRLLLKGAAAVGVFWGGFIVREPALNVENFAQLFAWHREGRLKPHVSKAYPLAETPRALRDMLERRVAGKVVISP